MNSTHVNEPYNLEDLFEDPQQLTDTLSRYLSMRYRKIEGFLGRRARAEQDLVRSELQRIQYFRGSIPGRSLSSDTKPLVSLFEQARKSWNEEAYRRCDGELEKVMRSCSSTDQSNSRQFMRRNSSERILTPEQVKRSCTILRQVRARRGAVGNEPESTRTEPESTRTAPESTRTEPQSLSGGQQADTNKADDRDYGLNCWHLSLKRAKGGSDVPQNDGQFQKIPVRQLLYDEDSPLKRLKRGEADDVLRYVHLSANNMEWAEACTQPAC